MTASAAVRGFAWLCAAALLPVGCAAPPLTLYTLSGPTAAAGPLPSGALSRRVPEASSAAAPLGAKPTVIEIARVSIPDELDTEDIFVRDGSTLRRSTTGRWASRLSLGVTDRLTARLAARRPDALVIDRPQTEPPSYRVIINISRLDVTAGGAATLAADWLILPHDPRKPTRRNRTRFSVSGPVATDQDVVTLEAMLLDHLAGVLDIGAVR